MVKALTGYLEEDNNLEKVVEILKNGGIAVLPTDTIYGFHCGAANFAAIGKIKTIKGEKKRTGFIVLASSIKMVETVVSRWPGVSYRTLGQLWPAPLTSLLPASAELSQELTRRGKVAVRVPRMKYLRKVIGLLGKPLLSTSVNRSGGSPMRSMGEIMNSFPDLEAYISRRGNHESKPSSVVDFCVSPPRLVRKGHWEKSWNERIYNG